MKRKFKVSYTIIKKQYITEEVELEVRPGDVLHSLAEFLEQSGRIPEGFEMNLYKYSQLSEPWVCGGWYDLHPPSDVMVFEPSPGNVFQKGERELLETRLKAEGYDVVDRWNGDPGGATVSFRVKGRKGTEQIPKDVLERICAPRPVYPKEGP